MSAYKLSYRYAKSIIDLAVENHKLDAVYADVQLLNSAVKANKELAIMLKSPIIPGPKKLDVLEAIFKPKIDKLTWSFLELIVKKGREKHVIDFSFSFIEQYNRINHISSVNIVTAAVLDDSIVNQIREAVNIIPEIGKVSVTTSVNEDLLGGFRLIYGDKLYDASVQKRLSDLRNEFYDESYMDKV